MADTSAGRLVSFLVEGDDVVSCEVCMEPFHPSTRPPKLLPCGHNFCEQCLFSICCHQQYYLLDSINCPTCRASFPTATARAAPTNYDLSKILENVHRGELNNVTVIRVSDGANEEKNIGREMERLADSTREAKHRRCLDCRRKLSKKSLSKTARFCGMCNNSGRVKFSCLECCVNKHNGHKLMSIQEMETKQLKVLSELREIRSKMLSASDAFEGRMREIGKKGGSHTPALQAQQQCLVVEMLASMDKSIKNLESTSLASPTLLDSFRCQQIHNLSKVTKMNSLLEKSVQTDQSPQKHPLKRNGSAIRQSRLSLRSDDSLVREAVSTLISILPRDSNSRQLQLILRGISPKDTVEERKHAYLSSTQVITEILYSFACSSDDLPIFADALLNCFYQLNFLSRKRDEKGKTSRKNIWKSIQLAYTQIMKIAAKSFPAYHPERVDCLDDLAYLCHLYSDVCDQATVALLIIEAARARSADAQLSSDDLHRTEQRLQMVDDHLVELRRLQRLQDLRSKTKIKRESRLKCFWTRITGRKRA